MILFITSLGTIIHKKLSVRLLNHTNTLSQLTKNEKACTGRKEIPTPEFNPESKEKKQGHSLSGEFL